jgi:hypothetical protein
MRYSVLIILACLLLILPVTGYTVPHIQTVIQCSNDPISTIAGNGAVDIKSTPPGAWYTIDGNPMGLTPGGQFLYKGTYTVALTFPHSSAYYDYSTSVVVCDQKVTYVEATLVPIPTTVPTTAAPVRAGIPFAQATTTITTAVPTTTVTAVPGVTTQVTQQVTQQATAPVVAGSTGQPDTLGSLSVTTNPAGAFIFIDGVQRGVTPATIPGIPAGSHTILLKLEGYQDLSTPVIIAAGKTQDYSTSLVKNAAAPAATTETVSAAATVKKSASPGFGAVLGIAILGAVLSMRRQKTE